MPLSCRRDAGEARIREYLKLTLLPPEVTRRSHSHILHTPTHQR
ncbi:hypothetical protein E2C01_074982 [Portunus trituberculatus]|uniref:Uncharacterized protein n=1 Tax=Portunus trituberculatus TaxID=210409 RepID=A0A5B7IIP0_PORTR|nr:hypothetical protein [Portunus trituberculatus]